jgi:SAM-dependent methyltransferase
MAESIPSGSLLQRVHARMLNDSVEMLERYTVLKKQNLMSRLHDGTVLEIGIGTAPNFKYYGHNVDTIVGIDPNPAIQKYADDQAATFLGIEKGKFQLIQGKAEDLPFEDSSIDAVVGTDVMCTVGDVDKALSEILRVLKPGGIYIFVDHVAAKPGRLLLTVQKAVAPGWKWLAGGCNLARDILSNIRQAGFSKVEYEEFEIGVPWPGKIVAPHIAGTATK